MVVAVQAEKDAEDPKPAPIGKVERAVKLNDGLVSAVGNNHRSRGMEHTFHLRAPRSYIDTRRR